MLPLKDDEIGDAGRKQIIQIGRSSINHMLGISLK
jgi:hypothetical protein